MRIIFFLFFISSCSIRETSFEESVASALNRGDYQELIEIQSKNAEYGFLLLQMNESTNMDTLNLMFYRVNYLDSIIGLKMLKQLSGNKMLLEKINRSLEFKSKYLLKMKNEMLF